MHIILDKIIFSLILIAIFVGTYFIIEGIYKYAMPKRAQELRIRGLSKILCAIGCIAMIIALWTESEPFKNLGSKHPDRPYIE